MELGISLASSSPLDSAGAARHLIRRARAASDAGLASLTLGDSHARPGVYLQNTPSLGRVLAEWDDRPAGCLFLIPMWPPVLVAEQASTLAALHDGPFIFQAALGGDDHQYAAMGRDRAGRGAVLEESLRIIRALFDGETVSSDRFGFGDVSLGLVPPNGVEWWLATMNPVGVRRAARMGATWYTAPGATVGGMEPLMEEYRAACDRAGSTPRTALRRDTLVLADGDRARRLVDETLAEGYRGMAAENLVFGTPEDAAEQLEPFARLGVDQAVARTMAISPETDLETIEALAEVSRLIA